MKKMLVTLVLLSLIAVSANATPFNNGPVVFGSSSEPSLQQIIDNVFYDSTIDAVLDQSNVRVWTPADGAATAYEVTYFAGNTNTLGIYDDVTGASFSFGLSSAVSSPYSLSFEFGGNQLLVNGGAVGGTWSGQFGFFLNSSGTTFYTEDDMNSGLTQAVAYQIANNTKYDLTAYDGMTKGTSSGNDDWLIAFEDISYNSSDKDFNDAVFYVKDISPVPEPGTLLLLGSGLIGLAFLKRRKQA